MASMPDIFVKLIDLPLSINGLTTENDDGSYTIFLNSRASSAQQQAAYEHELEHINGLDFEKSDADKIEQHTHDAR